MTNKHEFSKGKRYYIPSLYGRIVTGEVIDKSTRNGTVTIREEWMSEDDGRTVYSDEIFVVTINEEGNEQFMAWEYHGHEAYVTADDYIGR